MKTSTTAGLICSPLLSTFSSLKTGFNFSHRDENVDNSGLQIRPQGPSFNDLIAFLEGSSQGFGVTTSPTGTVIPVIQSAQVYWYGLYVQDHWKIRPNITLDAGIRWDDFGNPSKYGNNHALPFSVPVPGSGNTELARILDMHAEN